MVAAAAERWHQGGNRNWRNTAHLAGFPSHIWDKAGARSIHPSWTVPPIIVMLAAEHTASVHLTAPPSGNYAPPIEAA